MTESSANGENSEGTILLNLADVAEWDRVHAYCVQKHIPIEDANRRGLTLRIPRTHFEELPPEVLGKIEVFDGTTEGMREGMKCLKKYRARPIHHRFYRDPVIEETAEDDLLVRQLIPEHLLPRG